MFVLNLTANEKAVNRLLFNMWSWIISAVTIQIYKKMGENLTNTNKMSWRLQQSNLDIIRCRWGVKVCSWRSCYLPDESEHQHSSWSRSHCCVISSNLDKCYKRAFWRHLDIKNAQIQIHLAFVRIVDEDASSKLHLRSFQFSQFSQNSHFKKQTIVQFGIKRPHFWPQFILH